MSRRYKVDDETTCHFVTNTTVWWTPVQRQKEWDSLGAISPYTPFPPPLGTHYRIPFQEISSEVPRFSTAPPPAAIFDRRLHRWSFPQFHSHNGVTKRRISFYLNKEKTGSEGLTLINCAKHS